MQDLLCNNGCDGWMIQNYYKCLIVWWMNEIDFVCVYDNIYICDNMNVSWLMIEWSRFIVWWLIKNDCVMYDCNFPWDLSCDEWLKDEWWMKDERWKMNNHDLLCVMVDDAVELCSSQLICYNDDE
jgi:hypothetical protein